MTPSDSAGCPRCGADRLKAAPLPIIEPLAKLGGSKRRYKCSACGWVGRRHRLKRRNQDVASLTPRQIPAKRAGWFFVFVTLFMILTGFMAVRDCRGASRGQIEGGLTP